MKKREYGDTMAVSPFFTTYRHAINTFCGFEINLTRNYT